MIVSLRSSADFRQRDVDEPETTAEQHRVLLSKNTMRPSRISTDDLGFIRAQKSTGLSTARKHPKTYFP
jgi:hypothetical protein